MMKRVTKLPDKYRELRKEYHKVSNTIMMNRVTNLPDKIMNTVTILPDKY